MADVYGSRTTLFTAFPSASQSAGTSNSTDSSVADGFDECIVFINTTTVGAGGTLDVRYQISPDDGTTWHTRAAAPQITATGQTVLTIADTIGRRFRVQSVVAVAAITRSIAVEFKRKGSY